MITALAGSVLTVVLAVGAMPAPALAQTYLCVPPRAPFPDKLTPSDPLYETARDVHQEQLEEMEDYINCLDREREVSLNKMEESFDLFQKNFGEDGLFRLKENRLGDGNAVLDDSDTATGETPSPEVPENRQQPLASEPQGPAETVPPVQTSRPIDPNRRVRVIR